MPPKPVSLRRRNAMTDTMRNQRDPVTAGWL
jgi:hypothetical protein